MKMTPEDEEAAKGMGIWKGIQLCLVALMALILFYRYANYVGSHTNIPPGGDARPHNTHTGN